MVAMKVLLVEDEPFLADTMRRGLSEHGYEVDLARNGNQGLELALGHQYQAILLDIMLPGMHGDRVLQELRARDIQTPVIMLTAKDGEYDRARALDLGADDFLTKPFSFVVLLDRLGALTRRTAPERPVILEAEDLVVDTCLRSAYRSDIDLKLTEAEFALLECLMRNPGHVVSEAQVAESARGSTACGDLKIVEAAIRQLRLKVDEPFGAHSIETVPGVGYRVAATPTSRASEAGPGDPHLTGEMT